MDIKQKFRKRKKIADEKATAFSSAIFFLCLNFCLISMEKGSIKSFKKFLEDVHLLKEYKENTAKYFFLFCAAVMSCMLILQAIVSEPFGFLLVVLDFIQHLFYT